MVQQEQQNRMFTAWIRSSEHTEMFKKAHLWTKLDEIAIEKWVGAYVDGSFIAAQFRLSPEQKKEMKESFKASVRFVHQLLLDAQPSHSLENPSSARGNGPAATP